jgi:probable phosphoglycerate mutase
MRVILVRHGDAYAGFTGIIGGEKGCRGLTDLGRAQAEALRDHLTATGRVHADVLLSSRIPRAIETAAIIAPGLGIEPSGQDCDLCEVHTGEADGLEWSAWGERYGSFDMEAEPDRPFAPDGDSWNSFHARVQGVMERFAQEHEGKTVVAVCHGGVIGASIRMLLGVGPATSAGRVQPSNTGLTEWEWRPDLATWILHSFNEADHLLPLRRA